MATSDAGEVGIREAPVDHSNRGGSLIVLCVIAIVVTGIVVPLRFFVRARIVRSVGWDDWMILAAAVSSIALYATTIASVHYGAGRHTWDISSQDFMVAMKFNFITQIASIYSLLFLKVSICLFIVRLGPRPIYKILCQGTAIILTVYTIACGFTIIFQCTPIEKIWNRMGVEGHCFTKAQLMGLSYAHTATSVFTDFLLVLIPVPIVWNVQLPVRQKAILTFVLTLGLFVAAASSVKFHYVINYGKAGDYLWDIVDSAFWSVLEIVVGTLCTCIPALKPLFRGCLSKGSSANSRSPNYYARGSNQGGKVPSGQSASKASVYVGSRRMAKEGHESEESIVSKSDLELGLRVTQEMGVRHSEGRSVSSLEEGANKGQALR